MGSGGELVAHPRGACSCQNASGGAACATVHKMVVPLSGFSRAIAPAGLLHRGHTAVHALRVHLEPKWSRVAKQKRKLRSFLICQVYRDEAILGCIESQVVEPVHTSVVYMSAHMQGKHLRTTFSQEWMHLMTIRAYMIPHQFRKE
eukprot:3658096-Amphidinium_carterae.2